VTGKENTRSLGVYPDTGLADARAKRDEARKLLAGGVNPGEHRRAEKAAGKERAANSFEVVAPEWIANRGGAASAVPAQDPMNRMASAM
jgi:hypothetical protein